EDPRARAAAARHQPSELRISGPMAERVQQVIDEVINPGIAAHGGYVELVDVSDDTLYLRMGGGCQGCAASAATLRMGIERMVREQVPEIQEIIDVTDHTAGVNPYYCAGAWLRNRGASPPSRPRPQLLAAQGRLPHGQNEGELAPHPRLALDQDPAADQLRIPAGEVEAQPGPAV